MKLSSVAVGAAAITLVICYGDASLYATAAVGVPAAQPAAARVTRVINDVKLSSGVAVPNQQIADGTLLRTGAKSRVEITSAAGAISRLAASSNARLEAGTRCMNLQEGAVLFQVPKSAIGTTVKSGGITIEAAGATGILERHQRAYVKLLLLEGTARAYLKQVGESILVEPGQMLIAKPDAQVLPEPAHFDIEQLYRTSLLTNNDFAPLVSRAAIARAIQAQRSDPEFVRTNLVIFGRGTLVNLVDPSARGPGSEKLRAPPAAQRNSSAKSWLAR